MGLSLNVPKTKLMLFGSTKENITVFMHGNTLKQVTETVHLGIILDSELTFEKQAEYACAKAKSALNKICILLKGRKGLSLKIGIQVYKALIRTHLEYGISTWINIPEHSIKEMERVQYLSLRRITGAYNHSSAAALEVITGVTPVRLRLKELCVREYLRIKSMPEMHQLRQQLDQGNSRSKLDTPLDHITYYSRGIEKFMDSKHLVLQTRIPLTSTILMKQTNVPIVKIFSQNIGNSHNRSTLQIKLANNEFEIFMQAKQGHLMSFCDGSVKGGIDLGSGGCGSVLVNNVPEVNIDAINEAEKNQQKKYLDAMILGKHWEHVGYMVDNVKCELRGVVLSLKSLCEHIQAREPYKEAEVFVLGDCLSALEMVAYQRNPQHHLDEFEKIWLYLDKLASMKIIVKIGWIPGHAGIYYNDKADALAKQGSESGSGSERMQKLSYGEAVKFNARLIKEEWQRCWLRCESGYAVKEIIPEVGNRVTLPDDRSTGISFVHSILGIGNCKEIMHRFGYDESPMCDTCYDVESMDHIIFQCEKYDLQRMMMINSLKCLWFENKKSGGLNLTKQLVLAPKFTGNLTDKECKQVANIFFKFLRKINCNL